MTCPKCQHENREGAKFGDECGTKLQLLCPNCGSELRTQAKFCDECGAKLAAAIPTSTEVTVPTSSESLRRSVPQGLVETLRAQGGRIEGERRQVTVMFADVSGFTAMSENFNPEQITNIMKRCFNALGEVIYKYDGTIDKFMGDSIMVLFGAPQTHEDDAVRAVHAASEMQQRLQLFSQKDVLAYIPY